MDNNNFDEKLEKLAEISDWFENQEDIEIETGLKKVKEASSLIKSCKSRLKEVENEFEEIRKEINSELDIDEESMELNSEFSEKSDHDQNDEIDPDKIPF